MEKYPGIKVQAFDLGGDDVLAKTLKNRKPAPSLEMSGSAAVVQNSLAMSCQRNYVWRFIPDSTAAVTPEEYTQPLLMTRFGTTSLPTTPN